MTIAYYYQQKGNGEFGVKDIKQGYKDTLTPPPKNVTDTINQNIKKRLINKVGKEKNGNFIYQISKPGMNYVESNFQGKEKIKKNYKKKKSKRIKPNSNKR